MIRSPWVYTLSLGVYCTAWTFYGSVGLASRQGLDFLPVYLGPTFAALLFGFLLLKMLRITKAQGITSIADFVAARFGKSAAAGGPGHRRGGGQRHPLHRAAAQGGGGQRDGADRRRRRWRRGGNGAALLVLLLIALFSVLFGTRHIDATEHHEGMVLAVAFESVVKLAAFLIVGVYVTWVMFDGFGDMLRPGRRAAGRAAADGERWRLPAMPTGS